MKTNPTIPCLPSLLVLLLAAIFVTSCQTDDTDFSQYAFEGTETSSDDDSDDAAIVSDDTISTPATASIEKKSVVVTF